MNVMSMPDSGAAYVIGSECKKAGINEVTVSFANDYDPNLVYITGFGAEPEQCGHGTRAMQFICDVADKYNFALVLKPCRENRKVLNKFYPRFDYKYINDAEMLRKNLIVRKQDAEQTDNKNIIRKFKKWLFK